MLSLGWGKPGSHRPKFQDSGSSSPILPPTYLFVGVPGQPGTKSRFSFLKNNFIYVCMFGCAGSSLLHRLFSSCSKRLLSAVVQASHCRGFSCFRTQASVVAALGLRTCCSQALEHRLNSGGSQAWLLHRLCNLPSSGIEPASPALAGGFFTTEPPGKPQVFFSMPTPPDWCQPSQALCPGGS